MLLHPFISTEKSFHFHYLGFRMLCSRLIVSFASLPVPVPSHTTFFFPSSHLKGPPILCSRKCSGDGASQCTQLNGGGSESGGKAAQAQRWGQSWGPGGTKLVLDLPAPLWRVPCPYCGAAAGEHGSNPEPTAHTCTGPGDSAAAVSMQNRKQETEEKKSHI